MPTQADLFISGCLHSASSVQGPDLTDADVSQDDWVRCPDGRSYPKR